MKKQLTYLLTSFMLSLCITPTSSVFAAKNIHTNINSENQNTTLLNNISSNKSISNVLLTGRFDTSDSVGPKFAWSNSSIKANFKGTGISVNLKSSGNDWFDVIIDGNVQAPIGITTNTTSPFILASGLKNGTHTVELVKRTEPLVGETQFLGFTVTDGHLLPSPKPSSKRIMFIGDSITAAFGNEGANQYEDFSPAKENAYLSYAAMTARNLHADLMNISWSGKGIYLNADKTTTDVMPELYNRILPNNKTNLWNSQNWIPQVVVINLGTNDFESGVAVDKTTFIKGYSDFVDLIRKEYPKADIYCAIGPGLVGENLIMQRSYVTNIVNSKKSSGDNKLYFIEFPIQDPANGYGEDWHPSIKTHTLMANQLTSQIKSNSGW